MGPALSFQRPQDAAPRPLSALQSPEAPLDVFDAPATTVQPARSAAVTLRHQQDLDPLTASAALYSSDGKLRRGRLTLTQEAIFHRTRGLFHRSTLIIPTRELIRLEIADNLVTSRLKLYTEQHVVELRMGRRAARRVVDALPAKLHG